jgi:hypothetical protein
MQTFDSVKIRAGDFPSLWMETKNSNFEGKKIA